MPRPPVAKANRSRIIGVRFTPEERTVVEGKAETAGLSLSDYVRETFLQGSGAVSSPRPEGEAVSAATSPIHDVVAVTLPGGELAPSYDPPGVFTPIEHIPMDPSPFPAGIVLMQEMTREEALKRYPGAVLPPARQSWAEEWEQMAWMTAEAALERFNELVEPHSHADLPDGFGGWRKAQKIAWLEKEWPLCR